MHDGSTAMFTIVCDSTFAIPFASSTHKQVIYHNKHVSADTKNTLDVLSQDGVGRTSSHSANVVLSGNLDVSVVTPVSRPGVLDHPVVLTVLSTVTGGEHSVSLILDSARAGLIIEHSASVEQEVLVDSHTDRDGTDVGDGILELLHGERSGQDVVGDLDGSSSLVVVAPAIDTEVVTVVLIGHQTTVVDHPSVGAEILTSVATIVTKVPRAIHQVLLGELAQLAVLEEVLSLEHSSGTVGPARTAHALVLDLGDSSLLSPVDELGALSVAHGVLVVGVVLVGAALQTQEGADLSIGTIGEVVQLELVGAVLAVDLLDVGLVGEEVQLAGLELVGVLVGLLVVLHELLELGGGSLGEAAGQQAVAVTNDGTRSGEVNAGPSLLGLLEVLRGGLLPLNAVVIVDVLIEVRVEDGVVTDHVETHGLEVANVLVVPVLANLLSHLLLLVPHSASVLANDLGLLLKLESLEIGQDRLELNIVLVDVEAGLEGNHGHLQRHMACRREPTIP